MNYWKIGLSILALLALSTPSAHAISLEIIGPGQGFQDVSAYGSKVMLFHFGSAVVYIWTAEDGLTYIGTSDANSPIYEISYDGTALIGTMPLDSADFQEASIWTEEGGWQGLGGFPVDFCNAGLGLSSGWGISADGSVAVGLSSLLEDGFCRPRAFRWSEATGMVPLQVSNTHRQSRASAVSGDGQIAVGWTETDEGIWRPTRWRADGSEQLLKPDPFYFSEALAVNYDGSVVVGQLEQHAFYWTEEEGNVDLGLVPGISGNESRASGVSADGRVIVGWGGVGPHGFIWTPEVGMRNLNQIVADAGIDLGTKYISHAVAISADGSTIVGAIYNSGTFTFDAYRLRIGPPTIPEIPNGENTLYGPPLQLEKLGDGQLRLTWSPTCIGTESDYGVYQGTLGDFIHHAPVRCGTEGATEAVISPAPGDKYYLVVPFDGDYEASYGTNSDGTERPDGQLTCAPEQTSGSCGEWGL